MVGCDDDESAVVTSTSGSTKEPQTETTENVHDAETTSRHTSKGAEVEASKVNKKNENTVLEN